MPMRRKRPLYTPPEAQLSLMEGWNDAFGWGLPADAFERAEAALPKLLPCGEDPCSLLVLTPSLAAGTLPDGTPVGPIGRTFQALWDQAVAVQKKGGSMGIVASMSDPIVDCLSLREGTLPPPGLSWERITLQYQCGNRSFENAKEALHASVRPRAFLCAAGVLAAAALHPRWLKEVSKPDHEHDETDHSIWLPGYALTPLHGRPRAPWVGAARLTLLGGNHLDLSLRPLPIDAKPWGSIAPSGYVPIGVHEGG